VATAQQLVKDKGDKVSEMLTQVEGAAGGAHTDLSDLKQAQDDLNNSWADFSNSQGPAFESELATIIDYINHNALPALQQLNAAIAANGPLDTNKIGRDQHDWIAAQIKAGSDWLHSLGIQPGQAGPPPATSNPSSGVGVNGRPPQVINVNVTVPASSTPAATGTTVGQTVAAHLRGIVGV